MVTKHVLHQLIAEGSSKLASVPSGGGGGGAAASGGAAAGGGAAAAAEEKAEEKKEEKEVSILCLVPPCAVSDPVCLCTGGVRRGHGLWSLRLKTHDTCIMLAL